VNGGRTIERQMGDDSTGEPDIDQRSQAHFDHVAAQQEDDSPILLFGSGYSLDDESQITSSKNVGQAVEEGGKGAIDSGG